MMKYMISSLAIAALIGAPAPFSAQAQTTSTATVSQSIGAPEAHQAWSTILTKYISVDADGLNRFDYGGLKANSDDSAALDAYIAGFASLDVSTLSRPSQYVAWVNLYNAVTVQYIRDRYPTRSIRSGYIIGPWKKVFANVGGTDISLNDIEHEVLRKQWDEPRTHYAVNCASYGCPNLKPTAWEIGTLEQDLDAAARAYINHPRGVTIRKDGRLQVSTIYKWFKEDFGTTEANVISHLRTYAEPDLLAQIDARPDIKNYEYDWSLNETE